jgi:hypothetical protein
LGDLFLSFRDPTQLVRKEEKGGLRESLNGTTMIRIDKSHCLLSSFL